MEVEEENVVESTSSVVKAEIVGVNTIDSTLSDEGGLQCLLRILTMLAIDSTAADLKWSLFIAAGRHYKRDSCLRPFPPMFLREGIKDFKALEIAAKGVPAFSLLETEALGPGVPIASVELLHWVLVDLEEPSMSVVDKSEVDKVLALVPSELATTSPSLVVKLEYQEKSASNLRWSASKQEYGSLHAFHGSKVENFHSILQHGLQQHLTKNALFGQGVYLSSELLVCLPYSRNGFGWEHSVVGPQLSVVALCEIVDHPSVICQSEGEKGNRKAQANDSLSGEVPYKLYLVPNSDLIRMKYLLVYGSQISPTNKKTGSNSSVLRWLKQHKMAALMAAYAAMLAGIGISRSPTIYLMWSELSRILGMRY